MEKADSRDAVRVQRSVCVVCILGVPVEQLDLHGILHTIQVMLRSLLTVSAPVPHSMMEIVPEVSVNVNPIPDDSKTKS